MLLSETANSRHLDSQTDGYVETKLAKISEAENYAVKNRYRH